MTSDFSRALGAELLAIMRDHKVTQTQVAERIGRAQGYVSEHLNGTRPPETDIIDAIASLAGMTPRALMTSALARMSGESSPAAARPRDSVSVPSRPDHAPSRRRARG